MAIWHADNFSFYGTNQETAVDFMLNGVYAALERGSGNDYLLLTNDPDGISSGKVLAHLVGFGNNPASARVANPQGITDKLGVAFRVWFNKLPADNNYEATPVQILDDGSNVLMSLSVGSTGTLHISCQGGVTETTTVPVVSANGWYHIEIFCDQTNYEVRVESAAVLGPTAHTIVSPNYAQSRSRTNFGTESGTGNQDLTMYIKDLVCYDELGSLNVTFLGPVICGSKPVTGDISLNWTPSSGTTGWQILDNVPPVDATYISAADPPPSPYVGSLGPMPDDVTSVKALVTYVRAAKSDGGDGSLQVGLISDPSGTPATVLGADRPITISQTYWRDVFETDPKTSAAWTPAAADLAQIQIDRTT